MLLNHQPNLNTSHIPSKYSNTPPQTRITMDLLRGNSVGIPMSSSVGSLESQPKRLLALPACEDHIVPYATSKNLSQIKQSEYFPGPLMKNQLDLNLE